MNKKIHEFSVQAGISHMPSNYSDMCDQYKCSDFELEKFAQLITDECLDVCSQALMKNKYQDHIVYETIQGIMRGIISRFGDGLK